MRLPISAAISCSVAVRRVAMETMFPVKDRGRGAVEAAPADLAAAVQVVDLADPEAVAEVVVAQAAEDPAATAECESAARGPEARNSATAAGPMEFTA